MKILLTGAHGFTGRHFAEHAKAAGHEIIALRANLNASKQLEDEILQAAPDAVAHLAAISFVGHANVNAFYEVNVIGTLNLLDALTRLDKPPVSVLLSSSANIYGNCTASPIAETQPPAPVNHYAMSKLAMEYMAHTYLDRLPLFFTRPFNYTGPGQSLSFIIPKLVSHFAQRLPTVELGNLDVEREFNDVRFVCESYLRLLEKNIVGETINICSGNPVTLTSVISLLSSISGHKIETKVNPAFVRANEIHRLCGDPSRLLAMTGPIEIPDLADTLTWMLDQATIVEH
ncbi:NAD-dependent epimerase/dehydratase family protein [Noviherbaspirillum pedocola]|uniref:GDP-mannose 4,6-dehydratase n=1 Tax=Noviherbaspirillum pedocola TaxID=2801341 RepID=A0A934VZT6_9BURK|nr:NAD-dependent epimerase/dehydratase family protein [Noviherbaspirillum pedocola]MBK4733376.1 GDP-mannose 4,6-dehydratase [Noviherbaspirillum pedocola]